MLRGWHQYLNSEFMDLPTLPVPPRKKTKQKGNFLSTVITHITLYVYDIKCNLHPLAAQRQIKLCHKMKLYNFHDFMLHHDTHNLVFLRVELHNCSGDKIAVCIYTLDKYFIICHVYIKFYYLLYFFGPGEQQISFYKFFMQLFLL